MSGLHTRLYRRRYKHEAMTMVWEGGIEDGLSFLETLDIARQLVLTDPRDRVYAFLGFAGTSAYAGAIEPDYDKSLQDVHFDLASKYTRSSGDASILHYVQHNEHTINDSATSWIPSWNISVYHTNLSYPSTWRLIKSPSTSQLSPVITTEGNLQVRAAIVDTVRYASDKLDWVKTSMSEVISIWTAISNMSAANSYTYTSPLEVFARVLTADRVWSAGGTRNTSAYMLRLHEGTTPGGFGDITPRDLEVLKSNAENGDVLQYHTDVRERGHNRRVIMTQRVFYGLAPGIVQKGDLCSLIFGGTQMPFILRETQKAGYFKVVGESYIPGPLKYVNSGGLVALGSSDDHCWQAWGVYEQEVTLC